MDNYFYIAIGLGAIYYVLDQQKEVNHKQLALELNPFDVSHMSQERQIVLRREREKKELHLKITKLSLALIFIAASIISFKGFFSILTE